MNVTRLEWQGGPVERGSSTIIWSSLTTLALCVWTAVHPNVQLHNNFGHGLKVRLLLMIVAIIFPEVLISAAWHQRREAQTLSRVGHKSQNHRTNIPLLHTSNHSVSSNESRNKRYVWTVEHGYFVAMGGLGYTHVADKHATESFFTVQGISLMREAGIDIELTKADIQDRGNADFIAKIVVVVQVSWFAIQIVARLAAGLAITALEVHTIVHVACAMLMYALWWDKPYNVSRPLELKNPDTKAIGALYLFQHIRNRQHLMALRKHIVEVTEYWEKRAITGANRINAWIERPPRAPSLERLSRSLATYQLPTTSTPGETEAVLYLLAENASEGLNILSNRLGHVPSVLEAVHWQGVRQSAENFTLRHVWGSWTIDTGHAWSSAKAMHFVFNLLYGAGHLAAWNSATFPTKIEAVIWKVSGIVVASLSIYGSLWVFFWKAARSRSRWLIPVKHGDLNIIVAPFFSTVILMYFFARCFFLIESIISLRSLPASAYQTIRWSNWLPHSS